MHAVPFGLRAQGPGLAFGAHLGRARRPGRCRRRSGRGPGGRRRPRSAEVGEWPTGRWRRCGGCRVRRVRGGEGGVDVVEGGGGVALPEGVLGGQAAGHVGDQRVGPEGAQPVEPAPRRRAGPRATSMNRAKDDRTASAGGADAGAEAGGHRLGLVPLARHVVDQEAQEAQVGAVGAPVEAGLDGESDALVGRPRPPRRAGPARSGCGRGGSGPAGPWPGRRCSRRWRCRASVVGARPCRRRSSA